MSEDAEPVRYLTPEEQRIMYRALRRSARLVARGRIVESDHG